jgi:ATP-dependent Clp protease ATP-binding subunit ClpB
LAAQLHEQDITIDFTDDAVAYLAQEGFDPAFGARPVKRLIQRLVTNALSKQILAGTLTTDGVVLVEVDEKGLVFRNLGAS